MTVITISTPRTDQHDAAACQRAAQHRNIDSVQEAHEEGFGLLDMRGQDDRAQRRRYRKRRKQPARQRIGIGPRHRAEDIALDAAQREQRDKGRDDDRGGEEDRARDVGRRRQDRMMLHVHDGVGRNRLELGFREPLGLRQPAEDRLHHDHRGIDDQAEIDRADRQQVGRFAAYHQDADGEEQRKRNGRADDQRAAQIAEEYPLQQHDQADADDHVLQHGPGRGLDQVLAVIDALDMNPGRQDGRAVDPFDQLLHPRDRRRALLAAPHQHDALDDIVVLVLAGDAEPRLRADRHGGDVLDQDRRSVGRSDHGVGQRIDRPDQSDAAHHRRLLADIDGVAADIDVGVADGLQQLRQCQPVRDQLVEIDLQLVGLGLAAPAGDVDDAGHRAEAALQHPVLQRLEIEHRIIGRADQPVTIDLADRAERRDLRLGVVQERRHLRQPVQHLLQRLFIGELEGELQLDVGQAVQRDRPDDVEVLQSRRPASPAEW